jgi:peptide/nickel transport system substrate-binding protein
LAAVDLETDNVAVQQQLAQQWTDAGLDVELSVVDPFEQTATLLVAGDFDAAVGGLFGLPDPDLYYFWWHSDALKTEGKGAGYNYVGLDDPELDEALDEARATADEGDRRAALATVQERLAESGAYIWLWTARWSAVANERVHGLDDAPLPDGGTRMTLVGPRLHYEAVWIKS